MRKPVRLLFDRWSFRQFTIGLWSGQSRSWHSGLQSGGDAGPIQLFSFSSRVQRAASTSLVAAVTSLPPELLSHIFDLDLAAADQAPILGCARRSSAAPGASRLSTRTTRGEQAFWDLNARQMVRNSRLSSPRNLLTSVLPRSAEHYRAGSPTSTGPGGPLGRSLGNLPELFTITGNRRDLTLQLDGIDHSNHRSSLLGRRPDTSTMGARVRLLFPPGAPLVITGCLQSSSSHQRFSITFSPSRTDPLS